MKHERTRREKRWAVVTGDGRHVWLGRHTDPSEDEITRAADGLRAQGLTGWLAVTEGVYYEPTDSMSAVMVRPLAGKGDWNAAWAAFIARRADTTRKPGG